MPALFGVTHEDVSAMVIGAAFSATSTPTQSQVEKWILHHDLIVQGIFNAKGVSPTFSTDSTGYAYGHHAVLMAITSQVNRATQGQSEQAIASQEEFIRAMDELKKWVHVLGKSAGSGNAVDKAASSSSPSMRKAPKSVSTTNIRRLMVQSGVMWVL